MGGFFSMLFSSSSKYDIRKIQIGMTKEQVRNIFGEPEDVKSRSGTGMAEEWTYTVPFRIFVSIDFDREGRVRDTYRSGERVAA